MSAWRPRAVYSAWAAWAALVAIAAAAVPVAAQPQPARSSVAGGLEPAMPAVAAPGLAGSPISAAASAVQAYAVAARLADLVDPPRFESVEAFGAGVVQLWRLGNGMRVALAPDAWAPTVALHTWVPSGSADEPPGRTGIAHLLEHLLFKGTKAHPAGAFDRVLEQGGAGANAATWTDWTMYHEAVPPTLLGEVIAMEADRFADLKLSQVAFRSEHTVVRNERREHVDNDPDGQIEEAVLDALYGAHPYGHPVLGTDTDLDRVTREDAVAFFRQHYAARRLLVVMAGAVDVETALRALVAHHGRLPAGTANPAAPEPRVPEGPATRTVKLRARAERLSIAWRTVVGTHPDQPALAVLAEVLGNAESTRLVRRLVHARPLASHVEVTAVAPRWTGMVEVRVVLQPGEQAATAEREVDAVLAALVAGDPPTAAEVDGARARLLTDHFREHATADGRADAIGHALATFGGLAADAAFWQGVERTTADDVQRVARTWLVPGRRVVVRGEVAPVRVGRARTRGATGG
ncbi:MAG: insulinase family protein [Myxococcales bacterium]|nr:insulinase family protein [Myxococcales bacterium]